MELSEFVKVFKKYIVTFLSVLLLVIFAGLICYDYQTSLYKASIAVNISRDNQPLNKDYRYDQYYRLQADEKFGKNIVNWVNDPGFIEVNKNDFRNSKIGKWGNISNLQATQLSSNYVQIEYKSRDPRSAILLGKVLKKNLNNKNQELNTDNSKNWFKLVVDEAHVTKNSTNIYLVIIALSSMGLLLGMLGVLIRYYFSSDEDWN